ncbi:Hpt domain-containing protein [Kordiimonas aestuarii]|uniref:Hpt domain-containing protein n=1 Tax=Kordiimonas aestuarii TaxID=1005925 RepID=UPI0021D054E8|nr:Hpt domain-containing protein [Kordiimonas aestuarii]
MLTSDWDESVILDPRHLTGFTGGDTDLEIQVLEVFQASAASYLTALDEATDENWKGCAHKIKGAARGIGAWSLACAAERAEQSMPAVAAGTARQECLSELHKRLQQLNTAIVSRIKAINDAEMIDHE